MIELRSGDRFAGCKIIDICGKGGCGTVYLAEDAAGNRVAVKIINTNDTERELCGIRNYMPVSHNSPHLLPVYHVGVEQNELFIVMKAADPILQASHYLPDTLAKRLQLNGKIDPAEALDIIRKIAGALKILHDAKLIHRDIKPDNIIFVSGQPMLSDPGLICSTEFSITLAGTLGFLPPECFSGSESNSIQSDIYALGKLFYCMVTGEAPGRFPYLPRDLSFPVCRKLLPVLLRTCNTKKKKRYNSIDEFLFDLPQKLPRPGFFLQFSEKFRIWRLMHCRMWNIIRLALLAIFLLTSSGIWYFHRQHLRHQAMIARYSAEATDFKKKISASWQLLAMQLAELSGEAQSRHLMQKYTSLPADPAAAAALSRRYRAELNAAAMKTVDRNRQIANSVYRAAANRAFLKSPLGEFLTGKQYSTLAAGFNSDEAADRNLSNSRTKLEKTFKPDSSGLFEFNYIPPGNFISPASGKRERIDYPLWVANEKLTFRQFSRLCHFSLPRSQDQEAPAVRFLWNDLIHGCFNANSAFQVIGPFLPGYIVRPLTDKEYEYCASRNTGKGNSFGLAGINSDIYEMIISGKHNYVDSVIALGGDKNLPVKEFVYYQSFMKNVGTRIAIAPGSTDFYLNAFKQGTPQHFIHNGKHYEFFGHLVASFSRRMAESICRMLGGRLASIDSPELLEKVNRCASPVIKYNVGVAADFKDGKWLWANGKPVQQAPPPPENGEAFIMTGKRFKIQTQKIYLGFVCEWTEEEFRNRRNWKARINGWPQKLVFNAAGREYALFHTGLHYHHLHRRFAELLGGKLAEPESPELLQKIAEKTAPYSNHTILLGGYWRNGKFLWATSKNEITKPMETVGHMLDSSPSLLAPSLHRGQLCITQRADSFLIEFPERPPVR